MHPAKIYDNLIKIKSFDPLPIDHCSILFVGLFTSCFIATMMGEINSCDFYNFALCICKYPIDLEEMGIFINCDTFLIFHRNL